MDRISIELEGVYSIIKPKLVEQYYWYLENSDVISDEPSFMRIQKIVIEFEPILVSGKDRRLKIVHQGFQLPDSIAFSEYLSIPEGVAHRLHRMLPFEFAAAELCTRNIFEFENMPWSFYMDMTRITWDEARHAEMVIKRVNELDSNIGDFPLPKWTAYEICIQEPLHRRLLMLHRTIERI